VKRVLVDGYIRVSQVGGRSGASFISPSVQREQIIGWASLHGAVVDQVFEELDQSGARSDRPLLMSALERVESGQSQGIVVAKLDRFGRSLVDGLANIDRIAAADGIFVSVQDGLDLSTPTGKLVLRIMFSMAEWELDRVRANWETARARAVARGVHGCGVAPFGYRRGAGGRLKIDPEAAPVLAEVFRRRSEGATILELTEFLNGTGLKTPRGSAFFIDVTVTQMLRHRAYLGEAKSGQYVNPKGHPAIVDEATWYKAQRPTKYRSKRRASLLGGILRCGSCRFKMFSEAAIHSPTAFRNSYRCAGRTSAGPCPCMAKVRGHEIEGLIEDFVFRLAAANKPDRHAASREAKAESELDRAHAALIRYRDHSGALMVLSPENFAEGLAKRQEDVEKAALRLAHARRATEVPSGTPPNLEQAWPGFSIAERRKVIEEFIDCAFVLPGRQPAVDRVYVCRRGAAPIYLPRSGVPIDAILPFVPGNTATAVQLPRPKTWSAARIERELLAWRGEDVAWPNYLQFLLAGRARLHLQVMNWGGPYYWARRLGWGTPPRISTWSPEWIRGALQPILAGRDEWPSTAEFKAAGMTVLEQAVIHHGGTPAWAEEFGLRLRPRTAALVRRRLADLEPSQV
jgi:DNA invertase Pin-like site-specific DNA recombinase